VSEWLSLAIIVLATCGIVVLLAMVRQRRVGEDDDPSETPDVMEYMTMMIGVVYAIVLGLAIAGVWEANSAAGAQVQQEAQALHEISQQVEVFPEDVREDVREAIDTYVEYTVNEEWDHMLDSGELTTRGNELLHGVRTAVNQYEPQTVREATAYQGMFDRLSVAKEGRAGRAESAQPTMPQVVWIGLFTGAVVVIGLVFMLQIQQTPRQLVIAGLFTTLISFLLYLVWFFDAPYARALDDATEAFTLLFPEAGRGS
jgi:hypothetical protein